MGQTAWIKGSASIRFGDRCTVDRENIFTLEPFECLMGWKEDLESISAEYKEQLNVCVDNESVKITIEGEFYNLFRYLPEFFKEIKELELFADGHFLIECNDADNFAYYLVVKNGNIYDIENRQCELESIMNVISNEFWIRGTLVPSIKISRDEMEQIFRFMENDESCDEFIHTLMEAATIYELESQMDPLLTHHEVASGYTDQWVSGEWNIDKLWMLLTHILPLLTECEIKIEDGERYYFIEWQNGLEEKELICSILPLLNKDHEELPEPPLDKTKILQQEQWLKHIHALPENELVEKLQNYPWFIDLVEKTDEKLYLEIIEEYGSLIRKVRNPSLEMQLEALESHPLACWLIEDILDEAVDQASELWDWSKEMINNQKIREGVLAVKDNWELIKEMKNPSEPVQLAAVMERPFALKYINDPTDRIQVEAVSAAGEVIQFLTSPTEIVQLIAVEKDGFNVRYIQTPSPKAQLQSVKSRPFGAFNIRFIEHPTEEVIGEVKSDPKFNRAEAERLIRNFENADDGHEFTALQIEKINRLLEAKNE